MRILSVLIVMSVGLGMGEVGKSITTAGAPSSSDSLPSLAERLQARAAAKVVVARLNNALITLITLEETSQLTRAFQPSGHRDTRRHVIAQHDRVRPVHLLARRDLALGRDSLR